jgi:DNA-binding SARP family transcriptional activator
MPDGWCITLLGPVGVTWDDQPVDIGGPTARAVLAALVLRGRSGASVEDLISTVWTGPGSVGRDSVYYYVKKLRAAFASEPLIISTGSRATSSDSIPPPR